MNNSINELVLQAKEQQLAFDNATVKCGFIGLSGSGKSSLINAIAGKKIAPVGCIETTMEPMSYFHFDVEFVDLPGCGTDNWPQETYIDDLDLDSYDCFVVVTSNRIYEADKYLVNEMGVKRNKPCFVVRNKIDQALSDEAIDNGLSEEQAVLKIKESLLSTITLDEEYFYLVSARQPTNWDFTRLLDDIENSQQGVKKDKFIAAMATLTEDALIKKRNLADKVISRYSVISASNGINPIPGLDVTVDVAVLRKMVQDLNHIFGLTDEYVSNLEHDNPSLLQRTAFQGVKNRLTTFIAKYATAQGVLFVLKRMGSQVMIKNLSKYLPFVGQLIAAGVGYKMTLSFGESYAEELEYYAASLMKEVSEIHAPQIESHAA